MDSINRFLNSLPPVLVAILLLILAFIVAWIVQKIVVAVMRRLRVDERFGAKGVQDTKTGSMAVFIGKLAFIIVFLLFLPAVLDKLNMTSVSQPITGMIGSIFGYLPNLIAAGLILFIGHMLASIIGQVVESLLRRVNIDRVQGKLGTAANSGSLAQIVGKIVYALIMIVVVIAALQALNIRAISEPAIAMLNRVFEFLPNLVVAAVVIWVGVFIANLVGRLVTDVLAGLGADAWVGKLMPQGAASGDEKRAGEHAAADGAAPSFSLSKAIGTTVRVLIILFFVVEGLSLLRLALLENIGAAVIGYLPSVIGAAVILVGAVLLGNWLERMIARRQSRSYAVAAKVAVLAFGVFMALNQLQLGERIVTIAFLLVLGAAAVAFAISFGVGGRTFAANRLQKLERTLDEPARTTTNEPDTGSSGGAGTAG